jgi:DNA segregation ATPase FtsK/SpoIIIE, S-DNA-T family
MVPPPNKRNTIRQTDKARVRKDRPTPVLPTPQLAIDFGKLRADQRWQLATGVLLMLLAVWLLFAFGSYLLNGPADQSQIGADEADATETRNWLGLWGAHVAHVFVFRWFGIGALGLPLIVFGAGVKMAFQREPVSLTRLTQGILFGSFWLSLLAGYVVLLTDSVTTASVWCGGLGYEINMLLRGMLGWGSIVLIGFLLFVFVVFFFNVTSLSGWWPAPSPDTDPNESDTETNDDEDDVLAHTPEPAVNQPRNTFINQAEPAASPVTAPAMAPVLVNGVTGELPMTSPALPGPNRPRNTPILNEPLTLTVIETTAEPVSDEAAVATTPPPPANVPAFDVEPPAEDDLLAKFGPYDPTLDLADYQYPTLDLLTLYPDSQKAQVSADELKANQDKIVDTLYKFNIGIKQIFATIGPTVTLYEIIPADGVRIAKIKSLEDDIALNLAALGIRIIAPMPGKGTIGIEVPNKHREMVSIRSVVMSDKFAKFGGDLPVIVGKTISNEILVVDLAKMPHLLMAGATGQGKSVGLNVLLTSLLYKKHPAHLKLVLVDPKKVELTLFNRIERHFLAKLPDADEAIITDTKKVVSTLNSLCIEMDNRYNLLKEGGVRNIKEYNAKFIQRRLSPEKGHRYLPYIVLVIDELADLMMTAGKEVEQPIARLAQLARAIGIHLVVATQRPSVNVITGLIKANFPARLSFKVTSGTDSRTILDAGGADQLVGMGDMLLSMNSDVIRLQCPFVDTNEIEAICAFVGDQRGYTDAYLLPESADDDGGHTDDKDVDLGQRDPMFDEAARLIVMHQQGSTSLIQRRLKLGYNRSGRIIDQLEAAGIVGAFEGSKARDVLYHDLPSLEEKLKAMAT